MYSVKSPAAKVVLFDDPMPRAWSRNSQACTSSGVSSVGRAHHLPTMVLLNFQRTCAVSSTGLSLDRFPLDGWAIYPK